MSDEMAVTPHELSRTIRQALCQLLELAGETELASSIRGFARRELAELLAELMAIDGLDVRGKIQRLRQDHMPNDRSALYFFLDGAGRRLETWAQEVTERLVFERAVLWDYQETPCSLARITVFIAMWREYVALRCSFEDLTGQFAAQRQALGDRQLSRNAWMTIGAAAADIYVRHITW